MKTNPNDPINEVEYLGAISLTKREYFAAMAMQGFCADSSYTVSNIAMTATKVADALIVALNEE